uniref:SWI/SNF complex subunit SMARCC2 n=1 Tax=Romanomermis culicivorax TaxID=13658 RepID=A0A915JD80_ROMCU
MTTTIQRKSDGLPNYRFFETPETLSLLDSIKSWLTKNHKKTVANEALSAKALSGIITQLIRYQEETFGKRNNNPALTKLPSKCFHDFEADGGLCQILSAVFKFKSEQGWRRLDFSTPSRNDRHLDMFCNIEKELQSCGLYKIPHVFIRREVDRVLATNMREIIKRHQGVVVEDEEEATHVVFGLPQKEGKEEIVRPVLKRETGCMLHWLYTPDSYDNWLHSTTYDQEIEPAPNPPAQWRVDARWVLDMDDYNEWMNEEDYMLTLPGQTQRRIVYTLKDFISICESDRKKSKKRKMSPQPAEDNKKSKNNSKRKLQEDEDTTGEIEESPTEPAIKEVEVPKGRTKDAEFNPPKNSTLADLDSSTSSGAQSNGASAQLLNNNNNNPSDGNNNKQIKEEDSSTATEQSHFIVIPSYASWFDYNSIHSIEKRALAEFFAGKNKSRSPEVYVAYRNFMIDTYRLNPFEYLTSTACRRNLAGDVASILRVHAFLEQWGLINYQVDAENRPTAIGPPSTAHFMVLADTPMGLQPLAPSRPPNIEDRKLGAESSATTTTKDNEKKGDENIKEKIEEGKATAENATTTFTRPDIFAKKLKTLKSKDGRDWTDQETLLLFEALEMYKDDWNKIADHVGTRTHDECILRFLQLPIEDPYLESDGNEFAKIKDELPSAMVEAHVENVKAAAKVTGRIDPKFGLSESGIAGVDENDSVEEKNENPSAADVTPAAAPYPADAAEKETKMDATPVESEKLKENVDETAEKSAAEVEKQIQIAAAAALAAAAVKAKHLASVEDRRIKSLVAVVVETQMRKLELKMKHFEELEDILASERESFENHRQQLLQEKQQFQMEQIKAIEARAKQQAIGSLVHQGAIPANFPGVLETMMLQQQQALIASEIHTTHVAVPPQMIHQHQQPHPNPPPQIMIAPPQHVQAAAPQLDQHQQQQIMNRQQAPPQASQQQEFSAPYAPAPPSATQQSMPQSVSPAAAQPQVAQQQQQQMQPQSMPMTQSMPQQMPMAQTPQMYAQSQQQPAPQQQYQPAPPPGANVAYQTYAQYPPQQQIAPQALPQQQQLAPQQQPQQMYAPAAYAYQPQPTQQPTQQYQTQQAQPATSQPYGQYAPQQQQQQTQPPQPLYAPAPYPYQPPQQQPQQPAGQQYAYAPQQQAPGAYPPQPYAVAGVQQRAPTYGAPPQQQYQNAAAYQQPQMRQMPPQQQQQPPPQGAPQQQVQVGGAPMK